MGTGRAQLHLHHYKQLSSSDARPIQASSACTACFEVVQEVKNQALTSFLCLPFTTTLETTHPLHCLPKSLCCIPRGGSFRAKVLYRPAFKQPVFLPALQFVFVNMMPRIPLFH